MKKILIALLLLSPFCMAAQCTECNSVGEAVKKPEQVKSLIINSFVHKTLLDSVPAPVSKMVNLEILYLTDQPITVIPAFIENLKKLKELSFAACKLTSVPDFIFSMKNLKELLLNDNLFTAQYKADIKKRFDKEMPRVQVILD